MKVKIIRKGGEIQEMDLSPTDQIAMPLGTTIIAPDHWDALVIDKKEAKTEGEAALKIAEEFGTKVDAKLLEELDKKPKKE